MSAKSAGLHHITSIASDPRENVRFYTHELGLRLVKKTVNFDDPSSYHLYFGDETGSPGSIMTFFPWPGVKAGRHGTGQAEEVGYAVPKASIGWWLDRLAGRGIAHEGPSRRFDESVIAFKDPDGHLVEIVGTDWAQNVAGRANGDVPPEHAVRGFSGVTLWLRDGGATAQILTDVLRLSEAASDAGRRRFISGEDRIGTVVDIREVGDYPAGALGGGIVHHIAFRAASDADQSEMASRARSLVSQVTPQVDRNYFRSVYFREPGGVLFEIATDQPGFAVDEPVDTLGGALKLPPQYEAHRERIEAALPALD